MSMSSVSPTMDAPDFSMISSKQFQILSDGLDRFGGGTIDTAVARVIIL